MLSNMEIREDSSVMIYLALIIRFVLPMSMVCLNVDGPRCEWFRLISLTFMGQGREIHLLNCELYNDDRISLKL